MIGYGMVGECEHVHFFGGLRHCCIIELSLTSNLLGVKADSSLDWMSGSSRLVTNRRIQDGSSLSSFTMTYAHASNGSSLSPSVNIAQMTAPLCSCRDTPMLSLSLCVTFIYPSLFRIPHLRDKSTSLILTLKRSMGGLLPERLRARAGGFRRGHRGR